MKKIITICGIIFLQLSFSSVTGNKKVFKKLYALEGVWKMKTKKGYLFEEWKKIDDNYLQSRAYVVRLPDTITNERVALTRTKENIFYTPAVEDQNDKKPITFKLTSSSGNEFVFENPEHDFPKRIVYHLVTADSIHAWVDDGLKESKKIQHFYYSKQKNK